MSDTVVPGMSDKCKTCGNTYGWHIEEQPRHPFNGGSVPFKATFGDRTRRDDRNGPQRGSDGATRQAWPMDPVLRQALIDKGVLTPQDLRDAEEKIQVTTAQFMGGQGGEG